MEGIFKEELGNDIFNKIQQEVASELGYDDCGRACKNIEGASRFIELVYEKGHKLPTIEDIIENITHLNQN